MKVDIVIPVFNEDQTLKNQIHKLDLFLDSLNQDEYKIIIADNGSTDGTKFIGEELANTIARVSFIAVGVKGVGRALKKAWENSDAEIIGYMDLDLATNLKHLNEVMLLMQTYENDIINASRLLPKSKVKNRSSVRNLTSRSFNFILRIVFKTDITDGMCGFKFLRRTTFKSLLANGATSDGWFFATQLLIVGEMLGLTVQEIPIEWTDDKNSKVKIVQTSKTYVLEIIKLRNYIKNSVFRDFVKL